MEQNKTPMRVYVISGAGGMTGLELTRQILLRNDERHHLFLFDNGFNCNLNKITAYAKCNPALVSAHFGEEADIRFEPFMAGFYASIAQFVEEQAPHHTIEVIFINCAAVVHTKHFYHPYDTFETNVNGMNKFASMARTMKFNKKCDKVKFINCSTSEVYSAQSYVEGGVKETDVLSMYTCEHSLRTSYAFGKLLTEMFTKDMFDKHQILGASLRFANVYTEDELQAEHIIPYCLEGAQKGKIELLENAAVTRRTFLHNNDSASSILALIDTDSALDGSVYNVGTGEEFYIREVTEKICKLLNREPEILFNKPARKSDPERRLLNCDKIMQRTGWRPTVTLDEGLKRCVAALPVCSMPRHP